MTKLLNIFTKYNKNFKIFLNVYALVDTIEVYQCLLLLKFKILTYLVNILVYYVYIREML